MKPSISCIMSNYNTDPSMFREALDSILDQTYKDFELILIDDKSTDIRSKKVIEEYVRRDARIVALYNEKNKGLAGALNEGLKAAKGEYIARFDTDDICVRDRFERQMDYMKANGVDICSTFAHLFGDYEYVVSTSFSTCEEVAAQLLFTCYIYHTPVMMKRSFIEDHGLWYDVEFDGAEDFDLFSRCREAGARICIMPEVMFHYRLHSRSICHTQNSKQVRLSNEICRRQLDHIGMKYSSDEWKCHQILCGLESYSSELYSPVEKWCRKLIAGNHKSGDHDKKVFAEVVYNRFLTAVMRSGLGTAEEVLTILGNRNLRSWRNINAVIYKKMFALKYKLKGGGGECLQSGREEC